MKEKEKNKDQRQNNQQEVAKKDKEKEALNIEALISKNKEEYNVLWDRYVRLQAEFDNYRKRSCKERAEFVKFANEGLIIELVGILDNFERGIKAAEFKKDFDLLHQGVEMISKQFRDLLEAKGLNRVESVDKKFDPHSHEAVEVIESEDSQDDMIVEELQPGYLLNGRVIRPAKVKVSKSKKKEKLFKEDKECVREETLKENEEEFTNNNKEG